MNGQRLRSALEKLVQRNNYPDGHVMTSALELLLADHPAEPVGVSDEAVEAAYEALTDGGIAPEERTRAALEAAQPFMQPQVVASRPTKCANCEAETFTCAACGARLEEY